MQVRVRGQASHRDGEMNLFTTFFLHSDPPAPPAWNLMGHQLPRHRALSFIESSSSNRLGMSIAAPPVSRKLLPSLPSRVGKVSGRVGRISQHTSIHTLLGAAGTLVPSDVSEYRGPRGDEKSSHSRFNDRRDDFCDPPRFALEELSLRVNSGSTTSRFACPLTGERITIPLITNSISAVFAACQRHVEDDITEFRNEMHLRTYRTYAWQDRMGRR